MNGATNISITSVGSNLNANDCATVSPSQTTTYTLTATNSTGQIQGNVTVNVGTVQILSFTANPVYSIVAGGAVTLSWTTANATSVVLIGGDISPTNLNANGSFTVNPTQQRDLHLDGLRTWRPDRERHHLGVRQVIRPSSVTSRAGRQMLPGLFQFVCMIQPFRSSLTYADGALRFGRLRRCTPPPFAAT